MAEVKQEFTSQEKEAFAERIYKLVDSLNTAIDDMKKADMRVELVSVPNLLTGSVVIRAHVYEHICFNRKQGETE